MIKLNCNKSLHADLFAMKKIGLLIASLTFAFPAFTQSLSHSGGSIIPKGQYVDIYLNGGTSSCTPIVPSQSRWSVSPTPSDITYYEQPEGSGKYPHIKARWTSSADVSITVSYSCSQNGSISPVTTDPISFTVNDVTPSLDVRFTGIGEYNCGAAVVTVEAINTLYGGSSPIFYWYVDNPDQPVHYSGSSSYVISVGPGSHRLWMKMYSSITGTSAVSSNDAWVNVIERTSNLGAIMYVNGAICPENPVAKASVNVTGGASPYKYTWYRNGSPIATTQDGTGPPQNHYDYTNVRQGDLIYCKVESINSTPAGCTEPPTTQVYTIDIDGANPTVSITTLSKDLCEGELITFSSSKLASSYSWKLIHNGSIRATSNARNFDLTATSDVARREDFNPNSQITLTVDGLISSGCSGNGYSASTQLDASTFAFRSRPAATISPLGDIVFCTTCVPVLTASTGTNYTYGWIKDNLFIPNQTSATLTTDVEATYRVQVSNPFCTATSAPTSLKRNTLPQVNAGPDQHIALPLSSVSVPGTASDAEGPLLYAWSQINNPANPAITLSGITTPTLTLTNVAVGVYRFRLTVTDNTNESRYDEVKIIIDPPNNYNYVKENIINVTGIVNYSDVASLPIGNRNEVVNYVDGLGRTLQTVTSQGSPLQKDIVQPAEYDEYGREKKKFLPYVANDVNGWYKADPLHTGGNYASSPHFLFYQNGTTDKIIDDTRPYAETTFEPSPLNRPDKQYGAGIEWHAAGKYVQHSSLQNDDGTGPGQEKIMRWTINDNGDLDISSANQGYYPSGTLSITSTKDEHGNEIREYTDSYGRMICRKVQSEGTALAPVFAETYYVYDDLGNLAVVLPPEGVKKTKTFISSSN